MNASNSFSEAVPDRDLTTIHTPVLLERCVELLAPALEAPGAFLVDATVGMGGHTEAFLERFPQLEVVGLDRDQDALAVTAKRLERFGDRLRLVHTVYDQIGQYASGAAGILFDLGVSSLQLDDVDRGFSYSQDAPLDMRMNQSAGESAADLLATMSEGQLRAIFERYGEEKLSARYARAIIQARQQEPIIRSGQLVEILQAATPAALSRSGHPAKRVFQALRIAVNQELAALEDALPAALNALAIGGRAVAMSYQSLEDRMVKRAFSKATASQAPAGLPMELPELAPRFALLTKGAERASAQEQEINPRAIPVRLRAVKRLRAGSWAE